MGYLSPDGRTWYADGDYYTDAEILAIRTKAFEEARKYSDNMADKLAKVEARLLLAESFIPLTKRDLYDTLSISYGGSE